MPSFSDRAKPYEAANQALLDLNPQIKDLIVAAKWHAVSEVARYMMAMTESAIKHSAKAGLLETPHSAEQVVRQIEVRIGEVCDAIITNKPLPSPKPGLPKTIADSMAEHTAGLQELHHHQRSEIDHHVGKISNLEYGDRESLVGALCLDAFVMARRGIYELSVYDMDAISAFIHGEPKAAVSAAELVVANLRDDADSVNPISETLRNFSPRQRG